MTAGDWPDPGRASDAACMRPRCGHSWDIHRHHGAGWPEREPSTYCAAAGCECPAYLDREAEAEPERRPRLRRLLGWLGAPLRAYERWWDGLTPEQRAAIVRAQIDAKQRGML
jgi:hypothetical protein